MLLGFSGGADSTALLRGLLLAGCEVHAVHCNFHLRGSESDRDMEFCIRLCEVCGVPLDVVHFDVVDYMRRHGVGLEEACRNLRYAEFRRLKEKYGCARIAVAHNADDNIETLLLNLFRGAGISGLRGMLPDTGEILRPLLSVFRVEILEFLKKLNQDFITDSTNLESDVKRNFIRNQLLPLAETRWPGLRKAVTTTIRNMRIEEAVVAHAEREWLGDWQSQGGRLTYATIQAAPHSEWIIHRWGRRIGLPHHCAHEISEHIEDGSLKPGKHWQASGGDVVSTAEALEFVAWSPDSGDEEEDVQELFDVKEIKVSDSIWAALKQDRTNKMLWISDSPEDFIARKPRKGDRIKPLGMKGSSLVADVMRDAGLTALEKREMRIVVHKKSGEIIWIPGVKRSRCCLVHEDAQYIYKIMLKGKI